MLELGMSFSMEQLVIDNDIIGMMKYVKGGVEVTKETLAYDSIKEVGIGNNFLGTMETLSHVDLPSRPFVLDRHMIESWRKDGAKTDVELAHDKVMDILKNHVVESIDNRDLIEDVIDKADRRFRRLQSNTNPSHAMDEQSNTGGNERSASEV